MRKLFALLLLCPSLSACDETSPLDMDVDFRAADSKPDSGTQATEKPTKETKPGSVMTCAEILEPGVADDLPWLESVEPGVAEFPQLGFSCEEMLELVPNNTVSHGQAVCSWKVADYLGMELDALEFALWENDEGETVCGCRCPRCQAGEPAPEAYDEIGEGTLAAPFEIYNEDQLADLGMNQAGWNANYLQCDDIDLEPYYAEGGALFTIGENNDWLTNPFTGSYDGDEWEIEGFRGATAWPSAVIALFGHVNEANLRNIIMVEPTDVSAGLVYRSYDSVLENLSVGGGDADKGGIVGLMTHGTFDTGRANIEVFGNTPGGAVGSISGDALIRNVVAYGNVGGSGPGGLISRAGSGVTIENCEAHGDVSGTGNTGGLVGRLSGDSSISHSFATGDVTGEYGAGGLVGSLYGSPTVEWSYATGDVWATDVDNSGAGGLVGRASTENGGFLISNCYALGNATGGAASGLVTGTFWEWVEPGTPQGQIQFSYAGGDATATGPTNLMGNTAGYAGGLTSFMPAFDPFTQPPLVGQSFTLGTPTSNDDLWYSYMVGPTAGGGPNLGFNVEAQTGDQNGQGTAASLSSGDFQNPTQAPLNFTWVQGPDAWDFSEPLPTIPSAGVN